MATKKTGADDIVDDVFTYEDASDIMINMSEVEEAKGFALLPSGWYLFNITDDSEREIKNEGGKIPVGTKGVQFTFTIADGPYEGRKVWEGYWFHPTSYPYLKTLMKKSGQFDDPDNFHGSAEELVNTLNGATLWGKVGVRKGRGEYPDQNTIREFKAEDERTAAASASDLFS